VKDETKEALGMMAVVALLILCITAIVAARFYELLTEAMALIEHAPTSQPVEAK